ncbi:alpha/beta hydrolase family protein [Hoeflea prorocentri]|uniref:Prolyl oligopeptidase family serine peptidase n=1 Tax=Hoeflea prorocentri TaxID=1922333 RepID=A0A9X3ZG93_9HYPH|nr:alpha/beta fold hydrolase [Hoeflea prorocentri]MCY6379561.1 prolyl oligopeptidase family serine peptidase [Hoeflea prorocentri]MDA5397361.1 prolyl oligopeptidase family serine peptidase [Hoeflea prorocentri]
MAAVLLAGVAVGLVVIVFPPVSASHPALKNADLPELVPLRAFYADASSRWRFRLSPDGKRMAWLESKWFKPALWVRDLNEEAANTFQTPDRVRWYAWSADSRYLLYLADRDGWENDQLVSVDVTRKDAKPRTYDFGRDVKAWIAQIPPDAGAEILISHNGRDRSKFDLYRLNLDSGETEALDLISDRAVTWSFDRKGDVFARKVVGAQNRWTLEAKTQAGWNEIAKGGMEESFHVLAEPDEKGRMLAISNLGRDKSALILKDVEAGDEDVLYAHDKVDISWVRSHPVTREPLMAVTYPGYQERFFFDRNIKAMVDRIDAPEEASFHLVSATSDFSKAIWEVEDDRLGWTKYLVDMSSGTVEMIEAPTIAAYAPELSDMEPVDIIASDGLAIPAYLTRPKGVAGPAPMVMLIHGGPVARTRWGSDDLALWLANRGYAVLNVNYRGSSGYGRAFREAAVGEVSRKMHQDIVDARQWAVDQGIADPDRVAVMGGSFGGLKTMTAMTQNPELFAAGININGISDISTMLQEVPVYWTGWPDWYRKYIGDPDDPDSLADIRSRSPLYNAQNASGPMLIIQGANDVRVIRDQADRMVEALRDAGKDVQYTIIDGAGHTIGNMTWQQRILMFRQIERFLARHLGGRADGFDYAVLGAQIIP